MSKVTVDLFKKQQQKKPSNLPENILMISCQVYNFIQKSVKKKKKED